MVPFASLISQEIVDEFLRVGGNTDDLRLVIGTALMKQLSTESIADYMLSWRKRPDGRWQAVQRLVR